jgi:hypothetical protein
VLTKRVEWMSDEANDDLSDEELLKELRRVVKLIDPPPLLLIDLPRREDDRTDRGDGSDSDRSG